MLCSDIVCGMLCSDIVCGMLCSDIVCGMLCSDILSMLKSVKLPRLCVLMLFICRVLYVLHSPFALCSVAEFPVSTYSDFLVLIPSFCPSNVTYIPLV